MRRWQWIIIGIWLGLPLLLLVTLFFLSPAYMRDMFTPFVMVDGMTLFLGLEALTFALLIFGFMAINRSKAPQKSKNKENKGNFLWGTVFLLTLSLIFCSFPTLYITIFYPAIVRVAFGYN